MLLVPSARELRCLEVVYFDGVFLDGRFFLMGVFCWSRRLENCYALGLYIFGRRRPCAMIVFCFWFLLCLVEWFVFGFCCAWWSGCGDLNIAIIVGAAFGLACSTCAIFVLPFCGIANLRWALLWLAV